MLVWLICSEAQEQELGPLPDTVLISRNLSAPPPRYDAIADLLFETDEAAHLQQLSDFGGPVVVASLLRTSHTLPPHVTRVNAWPGFLAGPLLEACTLQEKQQEAAAELLAHLGKIPGWVPDLPGMIAARVIGGIINEAYLAKAEGVATAADIDTAMKLGTNYPLGPFEWAEKLGTHRVAALLTALGGTTGQHHPAANGQQPAANS